MNISKTDIKRLDNYFSNDTGIHAITWQRVSASLKESRPTVKDNSPTQRARYATCHKCKRKFRYHQVYCLKCSSDM